MDLKEEQTVGDSIKHHWYYRSKARAVAAYLRGLQIHSICDVGAGSGFFSRRLLETSDAETALCIDPNYETERTERINGKAIEFRRGVNKRADANLFLFMDVLEHVDDDRALLEEYVGSAHVGAYVLISVPAFQFLWSGHDEFLEHRRRYRLGELKTVVKSVGLEVTRANYFFAGVFPIAVAMRLAEKIARRSGEPRSQMRQHSPFVNWSLTSLCSLELPIFHLNTLAGLSAFCLARKI